MRWYTDNTCLLVTVGNRLYLYDLLEPNAPSLLAQTDSDSSIAQVAVNPLNANIAFSVGETNIVHILSQNGDTTTFTADGNAITAITFSTDGTHLAVASSKQDESFLFDSTVEIWNDEFIVTNRLQSSVDIITSIDFSDDNQFILTDGSVSGYFGNHIEYWDLSTNALIWDNDELERGLTVFSLNDPLAPTSVTLQGNIAFLAGVDGYFNDHEYYGFAVHVWDATTRERLREIILFRRNGEPEFDTIYTVVAPIMTINQSASIIATTLGNGIINLWDATNGNQLNEFAIDQTETRQLALSSDDTHLAILSNTNLIIYDIEAGETTATIPLSPP